MPLPREGCARIDRPSSPPRRNRRPIKEELPPVIMKERGASSTTSEEVVMAVRRARGPSYLRRSARRGNRSGTAGAMPLPALRSSRATCHRNGSPTTWTLLPRGRSTAPLRPLRQPPGAAAGGGAWLSLCQNFIIHMDTYLGSIFLPIGGELVFQFYFLFCSAKTIENFPQ